MFSEALLDTMPTQKVKKRGAMLVFGIVSLVAVYTIIYQQLLIRIAGVDASIISSLQVVIESLTTAGFGGDTQIWATSDVITGFVVIMNLTGVVVVFLAIPIVIVPLLQPILKPRPSKSSNLEDHVILCGFNGEEEVLIQELEDEGTPYLILSEDPEETVRLEQQGYNCIFGDLNDKETFQSANVRDCSSIVINGLNERTVSSIVTVREISDDVHIISVPDTERDDNYHKYAGSDVTVNPRSALADSISSKISSSVSHNIESELFREGNFEFKELLVKDDSELSGSTIEDSSVRDRIGATIVGIWKNGVLIPSPPPDTVVSSGSILLISGDYNRDYDGVDELSMISKQSSEFSKVAIVGSGVVGSSINDDLESRGYETVIVDEKVESADIVADVTDEEAMDKLVQDDFDAIILALDDDRTTIYTTVGLSSQLSETFILARCNDVQNVQKIYSAGADYVLSLSRVTQRMIYSNITEDTDMNISRRYEINVVEDHEFDGVTVAEENIRQKYGYTVIAVERDEEILHGIESDFELHSEDRLVVVEDN